MKDPRTIQAKINFITCLIMCSFEVGWFIYGNTLFYDWRFNTSNKNYYLLLGIVIWGYITMTIYLLSLLGILAIVFGMYKYGIFDSEGKKEYEQFLLDKEKQSLEID